ncbi:hypothetical protein Sjap_023427 [Stephania japonica]|uniref:Probable histone-arginine methyltransferase CARM1-like N-terminal PH domain-containing protein n=1 Tax=Stephania japonica TaxID=461633 RepID=A0AAP0EBL0_9MAGN
MSIFSFSIFSRSSSLSQIPNLALRFSSSLSLQNLNFSRANPHFGDSSMEGLLGQKLNRHEFSLISASKLPFSKESGEATAAVQFVVESGTTQLKFHYEVELSNVVVRVDLRSAQVVFELGPVESICVDEGSDGGENEKICNEVVVASYLNATLVIPNFHYHSIWKDPRDFVTRSPTGRFCNGKLAIDFTAENLGFKSYPLPYLSPNAKGTNLLTGAKFASTGSGYYNLTSKLYGALSLSKQLNYYKKYQEDLGKPLPSLTFWRTAAQEVLSAYLCARFVTLHLVKNVYEVVERRVCEGRYFDAVQSIK